MNDNKAKDFANKANKIRSEVKIYEDILDINIDLIKRPFEGYGSLVITGRQNIYKFNKIIDDFWNLSKKIFKNYTRKTIQRKLLYLLENKTNIEAKDFHDIYNQLLNKKPDSYSIFMELNGAEISGDKPIILGPYKFYNIEIHKKLIVEKSKYIEENWESIWKYLDSKYVVSIEIEVAELSRGYELAEKQFKNLENAFRFIIPDIKKHREIKIVDFISQKKQMKYAINSDYYGKSLQIPNIRSELIDLKNSNFDSQKLGTKKLFNLLNQEIRSELETQLLIAIDWIGKSVQDIDIRNSFIQLMFSIESLLNFKGSNKDVINPSILSRVSESIAYLLGENFQQRCSYEKDFKRLYGIRSTIAHGKDSFISNADYYLLLSISRDIVWEFLRNEELTTFKTFNDLNNWIKRKKYEW